EGVLEAVERHAQPEQLFERSRPAAANLVERVDTGEPVLAPRVHAAEDDAILEHHVDADRAPVERHRLLPPIDAENARDAAATQETQRAGHQLRVAGALDDEVEAAEVAASCGDVLGTGLLDQRLRRL